MIGYVVMPEHVHLLVSEPEKKALALGIQSLKLSGVRRSKQNPFCQARYYDFNVFSEAKRIEKLEIYARESYEARTGGSRGGLAMVEL